MTVLCLQVKIRSIAKITIINCLGNYKSLVVQLCHSTSLKAKSSLGLKLAPTLPFTQSKLSVQVYILKFQLSLNSCKSQLARWTTKWYYYQANPPHPPHPPRSTRLKVINISNHWSDLPQILNLGMCQLTELYKCFKWRRPTMEDDLKY